jgi:acyl-CoA synthetase (AMP-forming)/AMP-acid ligase II
VRDYELPTKDLVIALGQDEKMTHGGFDKQVYAYALGLVDALGVTKGSRVALWTSAGELETVVLQYALALVGATAIVLDQALGLDAVLRVLREESVRVLVASPRFGAEDRNAKLAEAFAEELLPAVVEGGTEPLRSKRFRELKFLVTTGGDAPDGVVRLKDIPVYGVGERRGRRRAAQRPRRGARRSAAPAFDDGRGAARRLVMAVVRLPRRTLRRTSPVFRSPPTLCAAHSPQAASTSLTPSRRCSRASSPATPSRGRTRRPAARPAS